MRRLHWRPGSGGEGELDPRGEESRGIPAPLPNSSPESTENLPQKISHVFRFFQERVRLNCANSMLVVQAAADVQTVILSHRTHPNF